MSTAAKVGAFFLLVLAIAAFLIWRIEDLRIGRGAPTRVTVQFKDVAGLDENLPLVADDRVAQRQLVHRAEIDRREHQLRLCGQRVHRVAPEQRVVSADDC